MRIEKPVAVLAGTPVDTEMGAAVLWAHGIEALNCPVSRFPLEQAAFQVKSREEKHAVLRGILRDAMEKGCGSAFIYCNSLSGSADFPTLSKELGIAEDVAEEEACLRGRVEILRQFVV